MKRSNLITLLALTAVSSLAFARTPAVPTEKVVASEARAGTVTLPVNARGSLVMPTCAQCPLRSFQASATTTYFIGERQVTLAELKDDLVRRPQSIVTVSYADRSGALLSVSAEPPRSPAETR